MSCIECCFGCLTGLGCRDYVLKKVAFHPPNPKGYDIKDQDTDLNSKNKSPLNAMSLTDIKGTHYTPRDMEGITSKIYWLTTKRDQTIPALYFHNISSKSQFVILYSHGNSTDIGKMRDLLQDISYTLNVHVFAYEYTGYGQSTGKPSDLDMISDVSAAYRFLVEQLNFKWNNIIMYTKCSIDNKMIFLPFNDGGGSGPSLYIASHPNFKVAGVILHSPIASGLRILKPELKKSPSYDLFPNIDMIPHVKCPVFIMHGQNDGEVPVLHGKILVSRCKNFYEPWWVEQAGHNDIDIRFRKHYFIRIARFVKFLTDYFSKKKDKDLEALHRVEDWIANSDHIYYKESRAASAGKYQERPTKSIETSSFASGTSSSFISHNTTTSKPEKRQAESSIAGAQTARNLGTDTARSMIDSNGEEKKTDRKDSTRRDTTIELEISYTNRSSTRQITDDAKKKCILLIEEMNLAKIEESDSDRPIDSEKKLKTQTKDTNNNDTSFDTCRMNQRIMLDEIMTETDYK